eukprot:11546440-Prorocentrum_lima.AAC.1
MGQMHLRSRRRCPGEVCSRVGRRQATGTFRKVLTATDTKWVRPKVHFDRSEKLIVERSPGRTARS